jgi:hypothetical protein
MSRPEVNGEGAGAAEQPGSQAKKRRVDKKVPQHSPLRPHTTGPHYPIDFTCLDGMARCLQSCCCLSPLSLLAIEKRSAHGMLDTCFPERPSASAWCDFACPAPSPAARILSSHICHHTHTCTLSQTSCRARQLTACLTGNVAHPQATHTHSHTTPRLCLPCLFFAWRRTCAWTSTPTFFHGTCQTTRQNLATVMVGSHSTTTNPSEYAHCAVRLCQCSTGSGTRGRVRVCA